MTSLSFVTVLSLAAAAVGSYSLECGLPKVKPITESEKTGRIVGGVEAIPHSWPWQVALCVDWPPPELPTGPVLHQTSDCSLQCGGTIVSPKYILTAAHCLDTVLPHMLTIMVDAHRLSDSGRQIGVARIIQHPKWDYKMIRNDIALIELVEELEFTNTVSPICLPYAENGKTVPSKKNLAVVAGWGLTKENGEKSDTLQQVSLPFVSRSACRAVYKEYIQETNICLGGGGGKDSCQLDSGGPAMKATNGRWYQYGVVSFGDGCARKGKPGVYARVTSYCDFFADTIGYDICVGGN